MNKLLASKRLQGSLGIICSILYGGLLSHEALDLLGSGLDDFPGLAEYPLLPAYLGLVLFSLASIKFSSLQSSQALGLLAMTPIVSWQTGNAFYGLGFAVLASMLLQRMGFFFRGARPKAIALSAALTAAQLASAMTAQKPALAAVSALASGAVYYLFAAAIVKGRVLSWLAVKMEVVDLAMLGLSRREREFVLERVGGKSIKQIAIERSLCQSTVRTVMSCAYEKLGLCGADELAAWAATRILH